MKEKYKQSGAEALATLFLLWPAIVIFGGFVVHKLWAWFAVPFLSAPPLPLAACIGLLTLKSYLLYRRQPTVEDENPWMQSVHIATVQAISLLTGYLAQLFL